MDMKLELVVLPVSDVDRAKAFYEMAGFRLDVAHRGGESFRVVQLTPPGSACSRKPMGMSMAMILGRCGTPTMAARDAA